MARSGERQWTDAASALQAEFKIWAPLVIWKGFLAFALILRGFLGATDFSGYESEFPSHRPPAGRGHGDLVTGTGHERAQVQCAKSVSLAQAYGILLLHIPSNYA